MRRIVTLFLIPAFIAATSLPAQEQAQTASADTSSGDAKFSQEELDQMLAPLALYPDSLLSQILMASTYPLEIVEADRWARANPDVKDDALTTALEAEDWDPSVKSLVNFPDVLASLSENLDWTTKIGDAFLDDQAAVMTTVQNLRGKAKEAGNLESSDEMVVKEEAPAEGSTQQTIIIESPSPDVIYVPTYDPMVVYGSWWYPAYPPPVYYRPPGFVAGSLIGFGIGFACGSAWGYAWGGCNWGRHDIDIDINRNININANIDRSKYKAEFNKLGLNDGKGNFRHDPAHRKGVDYRDNATAQKFGGKSKAQAAQARESFRGRADTGRADLARDQAAGRIDASGRDINRDNVRQAAGNIDTSRAREAAGNIDRSNVRETAGNIDRSNRGNAAGNFDRSRTSGAAHSSNRGSAFANSNRGGAAVHQSSMRGAASRGGGFSGGRSFGGGGRGRR